MLEVCTAAAGGDKGYEKRAGRIWLYKLQSGRMVLVSLPTYISAFSAARALGRIGKFFMTEIHICTVPTHGRVGGEGGGMPLP